VRGRRVGRGVVGWPVCGNLGWLERSGWVDGVGCEMLESSLLLGAFAVRCKKLGEGARVFIGVGVVAAGLERERFLVGVRVSIVASIFANMLSAVNGISMQLRGYCCYCWPIAMGCRAV